VVIGLSTLAMALRDGFVLWAILRALAGVASAWVLVSGIIVAALCVGGTFVVITQVGLQEARAVAGEHARALIAAMTSAFALGQIVGPLAVAALVRATGGFAAALVFAAALLAVSSLALLKR